MLKEIIIFLIEQQHKMDKHILICVEKQSYDSYVCNGTNKCPVIAFIPQMHGGFSAIYKHFGSLIDQHLYPS